MAHFLRRNCCVFKKDANNNWAQNQLITIPSGIGTSGIEDFGAVIDIFDDHLFIGQPLSYNTEISNCGFVYEYILEGSQFQLQRRISDPNANYNNFFGLLLQQMFV
ncbi:MAG: hypothetical protein IPO92_16425 [Saprospiraceae bacterium]|nr:hypothetical protein [Saprospiraceae bacterium]